jgi:hypothetical protein
VTRNDDDDDDDINNNNNNNVLDTQLEIITLLGNSLKSS